MNNHTFAPPDRWHGMPTGVSYVSHRLDGYVCAVCYASMPTVWPGPSPCIEGIPDGLVCRRCSLKLARAYRPTIGQGFRSGPYGTMPEELETDWWA